MAYNNAIPAAGDLISQSQDDIQQNFAAIQTLVEVNHETFAAANSGKHKYVTLTEQGADPVTAINELALYSKDVGGVTALFLRNENNGAVVDITTATKAATGTCTLPCGITLKWGFGQLTVGNQTSGAIAFVTPFTGAPYIVQLTPYNAMTGDARDYVLMVTALTNANFVVSRHNGFVGTAASFYYMAIGV